MTKEHSKSDELKLSNTLPVKVEELPALPQVVGKIRQLIGDDHSDTKKLAEVIETEEKTYHDAENHFFKINHAEIACKVCNIWNFPESIGTAIKYHHGPSQSEGNDLSFMLHMADYIAFLSGIGYDDDDFLNEMEAGAMSHLGLKQEDISEIGLKVADSVNKMGL